MGKQPMMGGHSSVMLSSRLMGCHLLYRSIPTTTWRHPTHCPHAFSLKII